MTEPFTITSDEMRALEQAAIESGKVTGLELMERAGQGVVDAIFEEWPELAVGLDPKQWEDLPAGLTRAVVLCGPGNNGGDGFVVARLLKKLGWDVAVFFYGRRSRLGDEAAKNYDRWAVLGDIVSVSFPTVSEADVTRFTDACYGLSGTSLVIDAAFGIGLSRPISGLEELFGYNDIEVGFGDRLTPAKHVSVDIPSGMFADDPQPPSYLGWFLSDLTVTFDTIKPAHAHHWTAPSCGKVVVKDIGL